MRETIFALATAPGRAAIAVVRASGPGSAAALAALAGHLPSPRVASLRRLRAPDGGEVFDEALVLWLPGPNSFTGEDALELHLHGGSATVEAATLALTGLGLRPAEPGEFSRRAFEAGRLSLTQAEAVADLVDAETKAQRRQALDQLGGALDQRHARWRAALVQISALLEAQVDFPDEDLPETLDRAEGLIETLTAELGAVEQDRRGEQVRDGFRVALIGAPNAGKSSLLNALAGRDAAIVTEISGTTRDVIEVPLHLGGFKLLLADTAGLRATADPVEMEGVRRARAWADRADLRLLVVDGAAGQRPWADLLPTISAQDWVVLSKADLPSTIARTDLRQAGFAGEVYVVSVQQPASVEQLRHGLERIVSGRLSGGEFPVVTRARHRRQLNAARAALCDAQAGLRVGPELAAEDVRRAARALSGIAGQVGVEEVLGEVFASFCVGK